MNYQYMIYKIYYKFPDGEDVVYLGRTYQNLTSRLTGHFQGRAMHKPIKKEFVVKVEYVELRSKADMFLYEIYYINKLKPLLNVDDKSDDELTIILPELNFKSYEGKWKKIFDENRDEIQIRPCKFYEDSICNKQNRPCSRTNDLRKQILCGLYKGVNNNANT